MHREKNSNPQDSKIYLVGSGIASLASAVYLIRDAGVPGKNIHILEQSSMAGGALDGAGDAVHGFVVRGGRMHEAHFVCYWDLLSTIPSYGDHSISGDEKKPLNLIPVLFPMPQARLLEDGKRVDLSSLGLTLKRSGRSAEIDLCL